MSGKGGIGGRWDWLDSISARLAVVGGGLGGVASGG
jgi:hypothetical protein